MAVWCSECDGGHGGLVLTVGVACCNSRRGLQTQNKLVVGDKEDGIHPFFRSHNVIVHISPSQNAG